MATKYHTLFSYVGFGLPGAKPRSRAHSNPQPADNLRYVIVIERRTAEAHTKNRTANTRIATNRPINLWRHTHTEQRAQQCMMLVMKCVHARARKPNARINCSELFIRGNSLHTIEHGRRRRRRSWVYPRVMRVCKRNGILYTHCMCTM